MSKNATKKQAASKPVPVTGTKQKMTSGKRAGLVFPVARFETLLRRGLAGNKSCVSARAKVALSAHMEYVMGEILEGAIERMLSEGRATLTNTDVHDCIHRDPDLRNATRFDSLLIANAARRRPIADGLKLHRKHPIKIARPEGVEEPSA